MRAYIFDLDGVLVDTAKYHFLAWKHICDTLNLKFDEKFNEHLKGVSRDRCLDLILEYNDINISNDKKKKYLIKKNEVYLNYINSLTENDLLPGAIKLLSECKKKHLFICLGSASKNALLILNKLGITHFFDVIIDGNKVTKAKPDPDVFYQSCIQLDIKPQECVVFEDSLAGLQAAKSINMKTVGIGNNPTLSIADIVIDSLADFKANLIL